MAGSGAGPVPERREHAPGAECRRPPAARGNEQYPPAGSNVQPVGGDALEDQPDDERMRRDRRSSSSPAVNAVEPGPGSRAAERRDREDDASISTTRPPTTTESEFPIAGTIVVRHRGAEEAAVRVDRRPCHASPRSPWSRLPPSRRTASAAAGRCRSRGRSARSSARGRRVPCRSSDAAPGRSASRS